MQIYLSYCNPGNPANHHFHSGSRRSVPVLAVLASLLAPAVGAAAPVAVDLRGFGTLGAVYSGQEEADFVGNFFQADGAGYSERWATGVDSKLGIQLDAVFSEPLSAVVQLVSQYDDEGQYTPQVEWANIRYAFTPDLSLRLGRIVTATFMESESRLVGYTYPWVRPPQELYGVNPITSKDGVDLSYRQSWGETVNTVQLSYGSTHKKFPGAGEVDVSNALDVQYVLEQGPTTLRLGYQRMDLDIETAGLNALFAGFEQFGADVGGPPGAQAGALAAQFRSVDTRYSIRSLGIYHNPGAWLLRAEWAVADISGPTIVSDVEAWYLTLGYRLGSLTPYVTAAQIRPDKLPTPDIALTGLAPDLQQRASDLNAGLDAAVNGFAFSQQSLSAGVRWEAASTVAVKLQLEHLRTERGSGSPGRLINPQADFTPGDSANVLSLAVDFVF
jgi:hypothetical protein